MMVGAERGRPAHIAAGAVLLIVGTAQYLLAQVVVAAAWRPTYRWWQNSISDLGSTTCGRLRLHAGSIYTCSPLHLIMNTAFVLSGALIVVGTLLVWTWWPAVRWRTTAMWLWIVVGALKALVGLVPENTVSGLHLLGALNLPLSSAAIVVSGVVAHRERPTTARLSLVLGFIGLLGSVLYLTGAYGAMAEPFGIGFGGIERMVDAPADIWLIAFAIIVLRDVSTRRGYFAPVSA